MSLSKVIDPTKEEGEELNIIVAKERPKPEIILSESLQKSIEIISKFDYKFSEQNIEYKECFFCKNKFPTIEGRNYKCQTCEEILCVKHRNILNHQCAKINPNLKRYLAAKNLIKEKKRMRRMMGK